MKINFSVSGGGFPCRGTAAIRNEAIRSKARENHAKPRPISSIGAQEGDGPLSKANAFANGLTDELKQQLLKEMQEARKRM